MKKILLFHLCLQHICKMFVINAISDARILILVIFEECWIRSSVFE